MFIIYSVPGSNERIVFLAITWSLPDYLITADHSQFSKLDNEVWRRSYNSRWGHRRRLTAALTPHNYHDNLFFIQSPQTLIWFVPMATSLAIPDPIHIATTAAQRQIAVTAYFTSKQLLLFVFAGD